jgi:4-aminobutyrate aminotransferase-like enzyme
MDAADLLERRRRAMSPAYRLFYREPLHLVRGKGAYLYDAQGKEYLDCYNNVASVGHCHPRVVAAIAEQSALLNTHTRYLSEPVVRYAERLADTLPGKLSVCMFTCSGSEANDLAFRIAKAVTGGEGVVAVDFAYHGTTNTVFGFSPEECPAEELPDSLQTVSAPCNYRGAGEAAADEVADACAALNQKGHRPAMFICDTAFSTNGVLTPPPAYFQTAHRGIRAAGGLAVADEVQAGLCRMGEHSWAFEAAGVVPDIVTMGKPLGNGYPLAALVTTAEIAKEFAQKHSYFNTFAGSPVAAAVGLAVLDVIEEEGVLQNVRDTGRYLESGLRELGERFDRIGDVRGKGLFRGIELVRERAGREADPEAATKIRERLRADGVLLGVTGPHENVIKIRPPLVFSRGDADRLIETLESALQWLH